MYSTEGMSNKMRTSESPCAERDSLWRDCSRTEHTYTEHKQSINQLMPSTKCMFQERHTGISEAGEILEVLCVNSLSKAEEELFAFESILIIRTSHLTFLGLLLSWRINKLHH